MTRAHKEQDRYETILLADYQASRVTYERVDTTGLSLLALTVTVCGYLLAKLLVACELPAFTCRPKFWPPLYALVPIVPLALLLLFADLANSRTVRAYYVRDLERQLRQIAGQHPDSRDREQSVSPATYGELNAALFGQRRGRPRYRLTLGIIYTTVAVLLLAVTTLAVRSTRPIDLQVWMSLIYLFLFFLLGRLLWLGTFGSRHLWSDAIAALATDPNRVTEHTRSLWSYLLLPRPNELIARAPLVPLAYSSAALPAGQFTASGLGRAVLVALVFELVLYQTRYVMNDLRGIGSDPEFSTFKRRNRFPHPATYQSTSLALYSCLIRISLAAWITLRCFHSATGLWIIAALATITATYEIARTRVETQTGRIEFWRLSPAKVAVYVLVGGGYALRGAVGLLLLDQADEVPRIAQALLITAWAIFGTMTVTAAWSFVLADQVNHGRLPASTQRSGHLGPLARQAGLIEPSILFTIESQSNPQGRRLGVLSKSIRPTPWNLGYLLLIPTFAIAQATTTPRPSPTQLAFLGATGFAMALVVAPALSRTIAIRRFRVSTGPPLLTVATGSILIGLLALGAELPAALVIAATTLALSTVYAFFRTTCLDVLQRGPKDLLDTGRAIHRKFLSRSLLLIAGPAAAKEIHQSGP